MQRYSHLLVTPKNNNSELLHVFANQKLWFVEIQGVIKRYMVEVLATRKDEMLDFFKNMDTVGSVHAYAETIYPKKFERRPRKKDQE